MNFIIKKLLKAIVFLKFENLESILGGSSYDLSI